MEKKVIKRVGVYGDLHLSSKDVGSHRDYPKESLWCFDQIIDVFEENKVDIAIGTGDLTYGRFHTLEYRQEVEKRLDRLRNMCDSYMLHGNHDEATYGVTEEQFYKHKGYFKDSTNLTIGGANISMIDYGKEKKTPVLIDKDKLNFVILHNYVKFKATELPPYGNPIVLDNMENWYGVDAFICGHIHQEHRFVGDIIKEDKAHRASVHYLPCLPRPAYDKEKLVQVGRVVVLTMYDNGEVEYKDIDIELMSVEDSFNLEKIEKKKEHQEYIHLDVSDVVSRLSQHDRKIGDPEEIIRSKENVDIKYRNKALELLREANK